MRQHFRTLIVPFLGISILVFYVLASSMTLPVLIMVMNSLFVGVMISISISYGRVIFPALIGRAQYDDVRQLTFGLMACFLAYGMSVYASIYIRSADLPTTTLFTTALQRWIFINGAVVQITAPDLGHGLFYGPDRKWLWIGLAAGVIAAIFIYIVQDYSLLK